nr:hypothetical protein [Escherichia coli]
MDNVLSVLSGEPQTPKLRMSWLNGSVMTLKYGSRILAPDGLTTRQNTMKNTDGSIADHRPDSGRRAKRFRRHHRDQPY